MQATLGSRRGSQEAERGKEGRNVDIKLGCGFHWKEQAAQVKKIELENMSGLNKLWDLQYMELSGTWPWVIGTGNQE